MDTTTQPPEPAKKSSGQRFFLRTAREVRGEVAKVYREYRMGKIDGATARDSGYLLKIILDSLRADELEARIEALEREAT